MKQFKVLQGRIYGVPTGEIVNLTEEKQTISPTNKQIKTSPKNK